MNEKYIARSQKVAWRLLDGEMIVMSAFNSTLFNLNTVATRIWQAADGHTPLSKIVRGLICEEFDVDPEVAYRDAEVFVNELASHGILTLSEQPVPSSGDKPWA